MMRVTKKQLETFLSRWRITRARCQAVAVDGAVMALDGKLVAFHCYPTPPGPVLTDDERAVLQVLKDARGIFAGEGPNGGMSVSDVCLAFRRESGPPHRATVAEIARMLAMLEANGRAKKLPNQRWIGHE